jgi:isoquinoline 1-oxidoreductase alpha subunit
MAVQLTVNDAKRTVSAEPEKPLLWVLREDLGLPGTKFGCGTGLCGACTVMIDGKTVRACMTPISAAAGKHVTTIEHVATTPVGKRVTEAWVELDVPQCGYCQAGQIMSATALLTAQPKPDADAIDAAMRGNLCRCATYLRIRKAIQSAANAGSEGAKA